MNISEIVLVQSTLEMMEEQVKALKNKSEAAVDYLTERVGFYENRCSNPIEQEKGGLSRSELVELHDIVTHYCDALEDNDVPAYYRHYISYVRQVRDRLGELRFAREAQ